METQGVVAFGKSEISSVYQFNEQSTGTVITDIEQDIGKLSLKSGTLLEIVRKNNLTPDVTEKEMEALYSYAMQSIEFMKLNTENTHIKRSLTNLSKGMMWHPTMQTLFFKKIAREVSHGAEKVIHFWQGMDGSLYATGTFRQDNATMEVIRMRAQQEARILTKLQNDPYIVQFYTHVESPYTYKHLYKFCNKGDLFDYISNSNDDFSVQERLQIIYDILRGSCSLEKKKILHRDIKLENFFVEQRDGRIRCKFGDFGFALDLEKDDISDITLSGSWEYIAPELFLVPEQRLGKLYETMGTLPDMWAVGLTLYQVFYMKTPTWFSRMRDENTKQILNSISDVEHMCRRAIRDLTDEWDDRQMEASIEGKIGYFLSKLLVFPYRRKGFSPSGQNPADIVCERLSAVKALELFEELFKDNIKDLL